MRVTLVHTSPEREIVKGDIYPRLNRFEGLGISYLASYLNQKGHDITLVTEMEEIGFNTLERILNSSPEVVGFYTSTTTFPRIVGYSKKLKSKLKDIVTIVGADHVSADFDNSIPKGIDFAVKGEGEITLSELLDEISNQKNFEKVDGLIYKKNGKVLINSSRKRIDDLDKLPFPMRDEEMLKVSTAGMVMHPILKKQNSTASVLTSRGCPYNCNFCTSNQIWGNSVKYRSAKNIVSELKYLKEKYKTNTVFFADLTFNSNQKRILDLTELIKEENLGINWYVVMRLMSPNGKKLASYELLEKMRESGLRKIGFGFESLADSIQKEYVKKLEIDYAKEIFNYCHDLGILTKSFLMLGYPEETKYTINETEKNLLEILPDELRISFLTPFPGTYLNSELKKQRKILTDDLSLYDTNNPIIKLENLSPKELISMRQKMYADYYNSDKYRLRVEEKIKKHPEFKESFKEFFDFLDEMEVYR